VSPPKEYEEFSVKFAEYAGDLINFGREGAHTIAPKEISIRSMLARMWAYLGFANSQFGVIATPEECYERPEIFLSMITFLKVWIVHTFSYLTSPLTFLIEGESCGC
jgi:hypothetical protein